MAFTIIVNGTRREVSDGGDATLLSVLREQLGVTGPKLGCGEGACGACTVLIGARAVAACQVPAREAAGQQVTTVEGLAEDGYLHPVQQAWLEAGALQCGYCTPGWLTATAALLARIPHPSDERIAAELTNICRCCTYPRIRRAVHRAAELMEQPDLLTPVPPPPSPPATASPPTGEPATGEPAPPVPWSLTRQEPESFAAAMPDGLMTVVTIDSQPEAGRPGPGSPNDAWVHVGGDGAVTAFTGKVEGGQGTRTALAMLVAEELAVPVTSVTLAMGDTGRSPFDLGTFGSRSMPYAAPPLRAAAAAARRLLTQAAAARFELPPDQLRVCDGMIAGPDGAPSVGYGDLVTGQRRVERVPADAAVTPAADWQVAGQPARALGSAEVVTGSKRFPADLRMAGMLHGCVLRPPSHGAGLISADTSAAGPMGQFEQDSGDVEAALRAGPVRLDAHYSAAYIAHAPLEPRSALARWQDGRLTVWTGTSTPFRARTELAATLDLPDEAVQVVVPDYGGGFGGKHGSVVALEAARLARAAGRPVHVQWNRQEEFQHSYLRPAAIIDVSSAAGPDGSLTGWAFTNINSGLIGLAPPYRIAHQRLVFQPAAAPLAQGSYRALAATANSFARESHLDELASAVGADPVELRLRNLDDDRLAAVLRAAAAEIGWGEPTETGTAHGIALGREKGGRVATAATVHVAEDGTLRVLRLVTAVDCGAVVHPEGLANQVEGAVMMGLGGALFEAIDFAGGRILNAGLSTYRVPRLADLPDVRVLLLDQPDQPSAGGGETPIVAVAPAIGNAIFRACGVRLRSMPLAPSGRVPAAG